MSVEYNDNPCPNIVLTRIRQKQDKQAPQASNVHPAVPTVHKLSSYPIHDTHTLPFRAALALLLLVIYVFSEES